MNVPAILNILKALLPTKKIGAWIVGILAAVVALLLGVKNTDLKDAFCAAPVVELPKVEVVQPAPAVEAPKPEVK